MPKHKRIAVGGAAAIAAVMSLASGVPAHASSQPQLIQVHAAPVKATPAKGVTSISLFERKLGDVDVIVKQITVQPGGYTTWHYHPNTISGVVQQGRLSHYNAKCQPDGPKGEPYKPGDVIVEPGGADHVHIGRNEGRVPVILDVTYYVPTGSQPAVDVPDPRCHLPLIGAR